MPVGAFPGVKDFRRRTIRAPVNPMDKSTVVSIYPRELNEKKPTIQPGVFHLPAGSWEKPAILVVGPSSWWKEIDEEQPLLEIPCSSIQVADSIVKDYCNGLFACNMGRSMPGIFWVPGEFTVNEIRKVHTQKLEDARNKQKFFFEALVKYADGLWARSNGNPLSISEDMRMAARELGLADGKPWMKDAQILKMSNCPMCGAMYNPAYPMCGSCKAVVNPELAKQLGIQFAK